MKSTTRERGSVGGGGCSHKTEIVKRRMYEQAAETKRKEKTWDESDMERESEYPNKEDGVWCCGGWLSMEDVRRH